MSTTGKGFDNTKAFSWLLGVTLAFFAWFGKVTYDKLLSMDQKLEMLLVQNGINNTKIENIENQMKTMEPCNNKGNKTGRVNIKYEAILPTQENNKKKYLFAAK
jgi:hypothetical protein